MRGHLPEADERLAASLRISRQQGYTDSLAQGLMFYGHQTYWQGDFQRAVTIGQEGLEAARDVHDGFHELFILALLCLAHGGAGDYGQALQVVQDGLALAQTHDSKFMLGRLTNSLGWLHCEQGDVNRAFEYDQQSADLGRTYGISNVEISALINLGMDALALEDFDQAQSYLAPTLERVEREAFGAHRWRWRVRLFSGLAELYLATGALDDALRMAEDGIREADATSSKKYLIHARALRGQILSAMGHTHDALAEFQRAMSLVSLLQSPILRMGLACRLGPCYERLGQEQAAMGLYVMAQEAIPRISTSLGAHALQATFQRSANVQFLTERLNHMNDQ